MTRRLLSFLGSVGIALLLLGCASHPPKVSCEGTLRPINPPAPAVHSDAAGHEG
jgi:hypothetical protein